MGRISCRLGAVAAGAWTFLLVAGQGATAAQCELPLAVTLPVTVSTTDTMLVPAEIDGKPGQLMVDTGSSFSMMRPGLADQLGLDRVDLPQGIYGLAGKSIGQRARTHAVALGTIVETGLSFLIAPPDVPVDPRAMGLLGGDVMADFGLELDPPAQVLKLYQTEICRGGVPAWAAGLAPTPIDVTLDNQIVFTARLDGQPVKAYLDTGTTYSILDLGAAKRAFDLDRDSPGMAPAGSTRTGDGATLDTYLFRFKTLEVAGITFLKPLVSLIDERRRARPDTGTRIDAKVVSLPDFRIGMHQLRQLHLYVDYDSRKLYVEPVDPAP